MKKVIPLLTLLAGIAISSCCYANNIDTQNQVINQVEAKLPDLNKKSIQQFTALQDNLKRNNINKEVIADQKYINFVHQNRCLIEFDGLFYFSVSMALFIKMK